MRDRAWSENPREIHSADPRCLTEWVNVIVTNNNKKKNIFIHETPTND